MSNVRYQITKFDAPSQQFTRVAQQSIRAGVRAEELPALLDVEPESVEHRFALTRTSEGHRYSFRDRDGSLCQLERV